MRRLFRLWVPVVAALALSLVPSACEEGPARIEGLVTVDGEGFDGITVTLSRLSFLDNPDCPRCGDVTTHGGGTYTFTDLEPHTYTVTISNYPPDVTFEKTHEDVILFDSSTGVVNFAGSRTTSD